MQIPLRVRDLGLAIAHHTTGKARLLIRQQQNGSIWLRNHGPYPGARKRLIDSRTVHCSSPGQGLRSTTEALGRVWHSPTRVPDVFRASIMSAERDELVALLELHLCLDADERKALWRRGIASLAVLGRNRPVPLEGLDPLALQESAKLAIETGLVDDMDWLSSSARALFDLMISLPRGKTKRELGRRVLRILFAGNASTFVTLASALATSSPKVLESQEARSRISLCLQMPIGMVPEVDVLALSLISCPTTREEWFIRPSSGNLIERKMAARILEGAAREGYRQNSQGNSAGLRVLDSPEVRQCWNRLLLDREPLAWRHAAAATGLLVDCRPKFAKQLERGLKTPSNAGSWRRAMCSLAASIAVRGEASLSRCIDILESTGGDMEGVPVHTMLYGISTAASFENELADNLLACLATRCSLEDCREVLEACRQRVPGDFGNQAIEILRTRCGEEVQSANSFRTADAACLIDEINELEQNSDGLGSDVSRAMHAYASVGHSAIRSSVEASLATAHEQVSNLGSFSTQSAPEKRIQYRVIRHTDRHILQSSALASLSQILGTSNIAKEQRDIEIVRNEVHAWLLQLHQTPLDTSDEAELAWRRSYLQTLIRLIDADTQGSEDDESLRERRAEVVRFVLGQLTSDGVAPLRRMFVVCLARACDAGLREGYYEVSDIILGVVPLLPTLEDRLTFAEASLTSPIGDLIHKYSNLCEREELALEVLSSRHQELLEQLPGSSSPRAEALRGALLSLNHSLEGTLLVPSREALVSDSYDGHVVSLGDACQWLAQLTSGARRRMDLAHEHNAPFLGSAIRHLDFLGSSESLASSLEGCYALADEELPPALAGLVQRFLKHLGDLPLASAEVELASDREILSPPRLRRGRETALRTTIAGYSVLSSLGDGGAGSVVLVCREAETKDPSRPLFALKRPRYSGAHSQVLSEQEFMELFRKEAGTLISLPSHENLAAFVTFDLGAKPDPILVMEYVQGPHLGRLMESHDLSCAEALSLLDGIAAGLEAMHQLEIGHLDLKPENIVVRDGTAVLVDFGIAGRQFRPGCGTLHYGAPEIFAGEQRGSALPVDVYSFGCLVYEVLCGDTLFLGTSPTEIVRAHLSHDGLPDALVALSKRDPRLLGLTRLLSRSLRQEPRSRISIAELRIELKSLAVELTELAWPLGG